MSEDTIYSTQAWPTNAAMIADVHRLGYLKDTDVILDPTYGKGAWWRVWAPGDGRRDPMTSMPNPGTGWVEGMTQDLKTWDSERQEMRTWDFRDMWFVGEFFDAVAFDPPYVSVGGRSTSGINGMHAAYGMDGAPLTPQGVQDDINAGLEECWRVVRKGGIVLVKCQSYVSSGKLWPGLFHTFNHATQSCGFQVVDHLTHVAGPRPQPEGRGPQKHARRNSSDLLVLRRPKRG